MSTSGSIDFSLSRDNIIKIAFQRLGIVGVGLSPSSSQVTEASLLLNSIVKHWNAVFKIPLWALRYGAIFPQATTNVLGPHSVFLGATGSHASTEVLHTVLTADSTASDTTLTVDDIGTFANLDNIGIALDDGTIDWTTVSGAPAGGVITITTGVTSLASTGNHVWGYTTKLDRPLRIIQAWTRDYTDSDNLVDTPMEIITPEEYNSLTMKYSEGRPIKLSYEALIDNGIAKYWPGFEDNSKIIYFRYHRSMEDFDSDVNTPDFPQEYYLPAAWELACAIAPQYGIDVKRMAWLRREADKSLEMVLSNDYEEGSLKFFPESR